MQQDVGLSYTGYFFVGLTTFILAYVTINDSTSIDKAPENSSSSSKQVSMIPEAISKPISEMTSSLPSVSDVRSSVESLNPFTTEQKVSGGKKRGRKTKRRR
jgi:hypothetical protein